MEREKNGQHKPRMVARTTKKERTNCRVKRKEKEKDECVRVEYNIEDVMLV